MSQLNVNHPLSLEQTSPETLSDGGCSSLGFPPEAFPVASMRKFSILVLPSFRISNLFRSSLGVLTNDDAAALGPHSTGAATPYANLDNPMYTYPIHPIHHTSSVPAWNSSNPFRLTPHDPQKVNFTDGHSQPTPKEASHYEFAWPSSVMLESPNCLGDSSLQDVEDIHQGDSPWKSMTDIMVPQVDTTNLSALEARNVTFSAAQTIVSEQAISTVEAARTDIERKTAK